VGKGNTFKAVLPSPSADNNQVCIVTLGTNGLGSPPPIVLTTIFSLQITGGTGRFKGLVGTISEDGSILPNVGPNGLNQSSGRAIGNLGMFFGAN
jgi:hypothetical protein